MASSRQLAAIMFTDIVGYTALMGRDEKKAFEFLNKNRQIQKPIIEQFGGHWIKELGDGVLASFSTVSDAVTAAIKIQEACNAAKDFQLRIGIHLGEVIVEDGDVFGDGVNIASRIQAVANPGSIFISQSVHNNISNKREFHTKFVKDEKLKNVKEPVRIYQVIAEGVTIANTQKISFQTKSWRKSVFIFLPLAIIAGLSVYYFLISPKGRSSLGMGEETTENSIAILPFADLSPEKDQEHLSDGLAEEIINSITIISGLKVIGRNSSFQFKGKGMDARSIGEKLNVGIVLDGSVQKSGNTLRIITHLIRVKDNKMIWSERFDKELKDIFAIQDSIANKIVEKLSITLSESEKPRLIVKEADPEAYTLYLQGLHVYKKEEYEKSLEYFLKAIERDSLFAPPYAFAALAKTWIINYAHAFDDFNAIREAKEYATKANRLDPNLAESYSALGLLAWTVELDFLAAKSNFDKSLMVNPSASLIKNRYSYFLLWMGEFDKAKSLGLDAINSDPADYNGYAIVTAANIYKEEFKEADKYIAEAQRLFPDYLGFESQNILNKFSSGNYDQAIQSIKDFQLKHPERVSEYLLSMLSIAYLKKGDLKASNDVLKYLKERPVKKNSSTDYNLARIYIQNKMKDSCFRRLESSFVNREPDFKLLKIDPMFISIRQEPQYLDLYHKYGFDRYK